MFIFHEDEADGNRTLYIKEVPAEKLDQVSDEVGKSETLKGAIGDWKGAVSVYGQHYESASMMPKPASFRDFMSELFLQEKVARSGKPYEVIANAAVSAYDSSEQKTIRDMLKKAIPAIGA